MAGDNVTDSASQVYSDVHTNVSKNVSGQELQMASVVSSACGVDHHTMHHPALVDCISENGNSQSIRDTLSGTFQGKGTGSDPKLQSDYQTTVNTDISESDLVCDKTKPIYDVNHCGFDDKFATSVIFFNHKKAKTDLSEINYPIFYLWRDQVDFNFEFVPLQSQIMPYPELQDTVFSGSLLGVHEVVKLTGKPNFLQARIPIQCQLNVKAREEALEGYWDKQLLELIKFGFPLHFNRACSLGQYNGNHSSANDFPDDIEAYLEEELTYGAILGPFDKNPIKGGHCSPFMTWSKTNSDRRRVIVDLSWPQGASVNAGIDKLTYLNSEFDLTFPTVDDITTELKVGVPSYIK